MKRTTRMAGRTGVLALALALLLPGRPAAAVGVRGALVLQDGNPRAGTISWNPRDKMYTITAANGQMITFAPRQVREVRIAEPPTLRPAVANVRAGNFAAAIGPLEEIRRDYRMLTWDVPAARYLAEAYLGMNQASKAVSMCKELIDEDERKASSPDLAPIYWEALRRAGMTASLNDVLARGIEEGSRELAARALIMRGNILADERKFRDALVDGFLRVVVLFEQETAAQPEALYQAARCFNELGEAPNAEKMRRKLLQKFPDNAYTERMKTGG